MSGNIHLTQCRLYLFELVEFSDTRMTGGCWQHHYLDAKMNGSYGSPTKVLYSWQEPRGLGEAFVWGTALTAFGLKLDPVNMLAVR